jgi:ribosomal protein L7/L12
MPTLMRDDTLVSDAALQQVMDSLGQHGPESLFHTFLEAEPHLGPAVLRTATEVAGNLALCGAPQAVVAGVHGDLLSLTALVYHALRAGSYEIWHDTALGERLRALEVVVPEAEAEASPPAPEAPTQHGFQVILIGVAPRHKTRLVATVHRLTGRTAKEARETLGRLPLVLFPEMSAPLADLVREQLEQAGGVVAVQPAPPSTAAPDPRP